jgi:hypothetical protein
MAEAMPALHHLDATAPHQLIGCLRLDALAFEFDRSLGHLAPLGTQQVGNRFQRCRLSRAVGTEQRHDPAFRHHQRHALEHKDHVIIDHFDIVHRQDVWLCGRIG